MGELVVVDSPEVVEEQAVESHSVVAVLVVVLKFDPVAGLNFVRVVEIDLVVDLGLLVADRRQFAGATNLYCIHPLKK